VNRDVFHITAAILGAAIIMLGVNIAMTPSSAQSNVDAALAEYRRLLPNVCHELVGNQGAAAVRRCVSHNTVR
jgi:hypothetical protein